MFNLFSSPQMLELLEDLATAEAQPLPGFARHAWVIARQLQRHSQSPPPWAISLLIIILDRIIPILLDWLKQHYGPAWPQQVRQLIANGQLPWQSPNSPSSPPKPEAP